MPMNNGAVTRFNNIARTLGAYKVALASLRGVK